MYTIFVVKKLMVLYLLLTLLVVHRVISYSIRNTQLTSNLKYNMIVTIYKVTFEMNDGASSHSHFLTNKDIINSITIYPHQGRITKMSPIHVSKEDQFYKNAVLESHSMHNKLQEIENTNSKNIKNTNSIISVSTIAVIYKLSLWDNSDSQDDDEPHTLMLFLAVDDAHVLINNANYKIERMICYTDSPDYKQAGRNSATANKNKSYSSNSTLRAKV